tara:strand:+ start:4572 stop:5729 length:1158 start_codon:yes stop_codon:yes gene_type:complete
MFNPIKLSTKYINKVIENGFRTSKNKNFNNLLIKSFCKKVGVKYGVTISSGTAALHTALLSLELKKGDEVIMPAITMSAVAYSIILAGAKPIFADVDINTMNIDPNSVRQKITDKTRAIICVSLYGLPPNYTELKNIIKKNKKRIFLVEDNAECLFAKHNGKFAGSFGDFSMFSFQSSKTITCGEGGILLTNSKKLYLKAKMYSNLGYYINNNTYQKNRLMLQGTNFKRHQILGFNYRLSELGAAAVLGQLEGSKKIIQYRIKSGVKFSNIVKNYNFVKTQLVESHNTHSYWAFSIVFKNTNYYNLFKDIFVKRGGDFFYGCWLPPYKEEFYKKLKFNKQTCKNAESIQKRTIQLKTNYYNNKDLAKQLIALKETLHNVEASFLN